MRNRNRISHIANRISQKIFLFALCPLLFALCSLACAKKEIKNTDSKGKNIICFGDSITFGYGAGPGEDYPAVLAKLVSLPVINKGIDGDTSVEAIRRLNFDVLARDPFLVIIEFGGNDFLRNIPREITLNNVTEMIDKAQAKGAMVALVDVSAEMFLKDYRRAFKRLASEKGAVFIPAILNGIITNPSLKSDFFHPNPNGYKIIADKIYLAIKPYLEKRPK